MSFLPSFFFRGPDRDKDKETEFPERQRDTQSRKRGCKFAVAVVCRADGGQCSVCKQVAPIVSECVAEMMMSSVDVGRLMEHRI
jgi:hypothetical protein